MLPQSKRSWACPDCTEKSGAPASTKRSTSSDTEEEDRLATKKKAKPSTIEELADLINANHRTIAAALSQIMGLVKELAEVKVEVESLRKENQGLNEMNQQLLDAVEELEQYSRKSNVIVRGVPEADSEREEETTQRMATLLGATGLQDPVR